MKENITNKFNERNRKIVEMRETGVTLSEIGKQFGISKQRVALIVKTTKKQNWKDAGNIPVEDGLYTGRVRISGKIEERLVEFSNGAWLTNGEMIEWKGKED